MNTTTASIQLDQSSAIMTRDTLAKRVISEFEFLEANLADFEENIRALWKEFENLDAGETILGCKTKTEFCETHLHRTRRAVNYMLSGGNPTNKTREIISRATVDPNAKPTSCEHCGVTLPSKSRYRKHVADEHGEIINMAGYICSACGEKFGTIAGIKRHRETHIAPSVSAAQVESAVPTSALPKDWCHAPLVCPDCDKGFASREEIKEHGKKFHGIKSGQMHAFLRRVNDGAGTAGATISRSLREREEIKKKYPAFRCAVAVGRLLEMNGDGAEHVFVTDMEEILKSGYPQIESEKSHMSHLLRALRETSAKLAHYADCIEEMTSAAK